MPGKQQRGGGIGAGSEDQQESEVCSKRRTSAGKGVEGEKRGVWLMWE